MRRSNHNRCTAISSLVLCGVLLVWGSSASAERGNDANGKKLYLTYCFTCHGKEGKGDGYAASYQPVKPRNLTNDASMSTRTDQQLFGAISGGSTTMHGPLVMPAWWLTMLPAICAANKVTPTAMPAFGESDQVDDEDQRREQVVQDFAR